MKQRGCATCCTKYMHFKNGVYFANKTWSKAHFSSLGFHTSHRQHEHNFQLWIHWHCAWLWHWTSEAGSLILFGFSRKASAISLPLFSFNYLKLRVMPVNAALMKWRGTMSKTLKEGHQKHEMKNVPFSPSEGGVRWGRWGWQGQLTTCAPWSHHPQGPEEAMSRQLWNPFCGTCSPQETSKGLRAGKGGGQQVRQGVLPYSCPPHPPVPHTTMSLHDSALRGTHDSALSRTQIRGNTTRCRE